MLRLRSTNSDHASVPTQINGAGRGFGQQDAMDAHTLESLVIMADEIAAFERDALGLEISAELPPPPKSLIAGGVGGRARFVASPLHVWTQRVVGVAAAVAVAAGLWQHFKTPEPITPTLASSNLGSGSGLSGQSRPSMAHLRDHARAHEALAWADPNAPSRIFFGGEASPIRIWPVADNALDTEERSLILAVFMDDDSPWCECVRVQAGTLCSGQRVDQVSKEDLITAAMASSCMVGAERVSIFAFTGPASKLPATREEAEALAITLAQLPAECLKSDPCVQHVASACLPSGVAMVSQTLAVNDVRAGW
jgi:hypothetical protein